MRMSARPNARRYGMGLMSGKSVLVRSSWASSGWVMPPTRGTASELGIGVTQPIVRAPIDAGRNGGTVVLDDEVRAQRHAEEGMGHVARLDYLQGDAVDDLDRRGEADALHANVTHAHRRRDTDESPESVD